MEWISVKDRLPDGMSWFLCFTKLGYMNVYYFMDGIWHDVDDEYEHIEKAAQSIITHWIPLPEPPVAP